MSPELKTEIPDVILEATASSTSQLGTWIKKRKKLSCWASLEVE